MLYFEHRLDLSDKQAGGAIPSVRLNRKHYAMTITAIAPSFEAIDHAVEQATPVITRIARELWDLAELSLSEVKSARLLTTILEEEGFTITSKGTAGVPTAFIAEWGTGDPIIGILAEYDALPGLGNAAVPRREPASNGLTSGHGCGHNLFGAASIGAAIALKQVLSENLLPGTVRLYGCAAEETEGAKIYMARAGLFNDLDAALHWHPGAEARVANARTAAINNIRIEFFGEICSRGGRALEGSQRSTCGRNICSWD